MGAVHLDEHLVETVEDEDTPTPLHRFKNLPAGGFGTQAIGGVDEEVKNPLQIGRRPQRADVEVPEVEKHRQRRQGIRIVFC